MKTGISESEFCSSPRLVEPVGAAQAESAYERPEAAGLVLLLCLNFCRPHEPTCSIQLMASSSGSSISSSQNYRVFPALCSCSSYLLLDRRKASGDQPHGYFRSRSTSSNSSRTSHEHFLFGITKRDRPNSLGHHFPQSDSNRMKPVCVQASAHPR